MPHIHRRFGALGSQATTCAALFALAACGSSSDATPGVNTGDGGSSGTGGEGGAQDGALAADGAPRDGGADVVFDAPLPRGPGRITLRLPDGKWHRLAAATGGASQDLTAPMESISTGSDDFVNTSRDGDWFVATGSRFSCATGGCLDIFTGDLKKGSEVQPGGTSVQTASARATVADGGNVIVYPGKNGPHSVDLYSVTRVGGVWGAPVLLTGASTFAFHHDASIAPDGTRVVFDCGADPYAQPPTSICEVGTDGKGFQEVLSPSDGPDKGASHALHHPDYTPQGDFVFEADWPSEQIWKVARGSKSPVKVSPANQTDDNSPCVLPDGHIASLWLGRAGNTGSAHEVKVMNADGSGSVMVLTGTDVVDIGMSCSN